MNRRIGMISSSITLISVIFFALFMLLGASSMAYGICILLACGYIIMVGAFSSYTTKAVESAKYASIIFAIIYAVFVILVYYAQITTLVQNTLTEQANLILDYQKFGLFFSYNLFGYGMLSISTFFLGLTISDEHKENKTLKLLLIIHGIFSLVCFIPILGVFNPGMAGGDIIGIAVLELWCIYFIPICILSYQYFKRKKS